MNILSFFQNSIFWIYRNLQGIIIIFFQKVGYIFNEIVQNTEYNFDHLPLHLLILSLIIGLGIFAYIRLAYPFWSTQPVYHAYDFYYSYYSAPFLIQSGYPIKTRFFKPEPQIQTFEYTDLTESQKRQVVNLIQSHSIAEESALYMFHLGNLDTYLTGQSSQSLVSIYFEEAFIPLPKKIVIDTTTVTDKTQIEVVKKPIGCITSRIVEITINGIHNSVYFLDFIVVNREKASISNGRISREMIHTHEYRQRYKSLETSKKTKEMDSPIRISLFKKENGLSEGIVPLVSYISTLMYIRNERIKKLPPHYLLVPIHRRNIHLLIDFLEISKTQFQCFGIAELPNLSALIHSGILKVFIIQKEKEIYAAYFFRDSRTQYDRSIDTDSESGALLILCGSIRNTKSVDLFYMGFLHSLRTVLRETPDFKLLLFEGISQNIEIQDRHVGNSDKLEKNIIGETPSAYYLYNYVIPKQPLLAENCFMVF